MDEQYSTIYITGTEGEIDNWYQYDAFGVMRDYQEKFLNRILYTGQQYDSITEQYYLRARYYNPVTGRFLQEDVYRGDGLNLYAYCRNNPVIYYDPSGYVSGTLLDNELSIGTYSYLRKKYGGAEKSGLTPHHMASAEYMQRRYGVSKGDGLCMMMETTYGNSGGRHGKTATYGGISSDYYNLTPRQALAHDLFDMRAKLMEARLYDDKARKKLHDFAKMQQEMEYSTSKKNKNDPNFKGKIIEKEKIFSKDYEDNKIDKNNKVNEGCKGE